MILILAALLRNNMINIRRLAKSDYLKLVPILALAFYIAFIPHQNYPYLVHLDEWIHLARSNAMLQAGSVTFIDPFSGQSTIGPSSNLETGFQLFWPVFHQVSGISWLTIFKYSSGIVFILTVLSVYILARREGFGWEAALFTCLIPTTVGILGPGLLVPVAMGLLFVPLAIFVAFNFRTGWSYIALFVFTGFLLFLHAPTAVGLVIILTPLATRGGENSYGLILGLLALLLMLATFFTLHYGLIAVYYRGLMWMMLMVGIVAGAGLMGVKNLRLPARLSTWLKAPLITQNVGRFLCLALIGVILAIAIPVRQDTPYYHMIDQEDYEAFVWIKDNVNESYEKAILDPWKATAFAAITGKYVYTFIGEYPKPSDTEAYDFLRSGSSDTNFLRKNGISLVYTQLGKP